MCARTRACVHACMCVCVCVCVSRGGGGCFSLFCGNIFLKLLLWNRVKKWESIKIFCKLVHLKVSYLSSTVSNMADSSTEFRYLRDNVTIDVNSSSLHILEEST